MELIVNGKHYRLEVAPERMLLWVLRDDLGLTGSKYGCGEGQCGACTVLINGSPARSCITRAAAAASRPITTIEGLAPNGRLHPLQEAFIEADAMQCGYCTPGMIMSGAALLKKNPQANEAEIRSFMEGNVCRCGTYPRIVEAVKMAERKMAAKMNEAGQYA